MSQNTYQDYNNTPPSGHEPASSGPGSYQKPLPLNQALRQLPHQYIRVLTKPSAGRFEEELSKASWNIIVVQLLILIVVGIILDTISSFLVKTSGADSTLIEMSQQALPALKGLLSSPFIGVVFLTIIFVPIVFFGRVITQFLLGIAFSGYGTFRTQSYATLLYNVPLSIIISTLGLLGTIPVAGTMIVDLITAALGFYIVVLDIYQIMATQYLSGGKATAVVLLSYVILVFVLGFCGIVLLTALHHIA